jgi:hypothetical protein
VWHRLPADDELMFFNEQGAFPETYRELIRSLRGAAIDHIFVGAVAMKAYGCEYAEDKIEFCVRQPDLERFRGEFAGYVFDLLPGQLCRYCHPRTQVRIELLTSGEIAGDRLRQQEIRLPDPSEAEFVDGIPVPSLARLVELKLASWNPRDLCDATALIRAKKLCAAFADHLHPVVRAAFGECVGQGRQPTIH